jgi:S1-C subfamily serine protease
VQALTAAGVLANGSMPKGQADRAGLHAGDGILSYAGALVATIERLAQMEDEGDAATRTVTVEREGK